MPHAFEDVTSVLEGKDADFDLGKIARRNEQGLEALPMDYVVGVGNMLAFYKEYKETKVQGKREASEKSFEKFSVEAKRMSELRRMFVSNQPGFLHAQKEISDMLNQYGFGVTAIEPEAAYGEAMPDEDFVQKLRNNESISLCDRKLLEIIKEARF